MAANLCHYERARGRTVPSAVHHKATILPDLYISDRNLLGTGHLRALADVTALPHKRVLPADPLTLCGAPSPFFVLSRTHHGRCRT